MNPHIRFQISKKKKRKQGRRVHGGKKNGQQEGRKMEVNIRQMVSGKKKGRLQERKIQEGGITQREHGYPR